MKINDVLRPLGIKSETLKYVKVTVSCVYITLKNGLTLEVR